MGTRASFHVLPKAVAKKLWNETNQDTVFDTLHPLEEIVYDFCTDAVIDVAKKMKRVTKSKLEAECDIWMCKMGEPEFKEFMERVRWYAKRQITKYPGDDQFLEHVLPYNVWGKGEKWDLCISTDWVSAFYECHLIYKMMDWKNNYIYCEIG